MFGRSATLCGPAGGVEQAATKMSAMRGTEVFSTEFTCRVPEVDDVIRES
jgi:hypothetical protein